MSYSEVVIGELRDDWMDGDEPVVAVIGLDMALQAITDWESDRPIAPGAVRMIRCIAGALLDIHREELDKQSIEAAAKIYELSELIVQRHGNSHHLAYSVPF